LSHTHTKNPFLYLWRHPRRTGFIIFNVIVIVLLIGWGVFTNSMSHAGIGGIPNVMLGYTGMALLIVVWLVGWIAWAVMVTSRHVHHVAPPEAATPPDK
jgi:protein-S-isoprenylcysteine O-methyltransferase Ste14